METTIEDIIIKDEITMPFVNHPPILRKDIYDVEWTDTKVVLITIMSIINVFMFFGNILSIVTICYTPKLRQQVSYWFVMNLAVIDLVISITVVPINTIWEYYGTWPFSRTTCEFFTFADISFSTISAYSIVLVSIDKYMYISYSIHYFDKMTRKLAVVMIIVVWVMVFIFATVSIVSEVGTDEQFEDHFLMLPNSTNICVFVMTDEYVLPLVIFSFFVPFLILCFTTSRITCIASRHIKKIHAITIPVTSETDSETIRTSDKSRPRRHTFGGEEVSNLPQRMTNLRRGSSNMNIYKEKQCTISTIQEGKTNCADMIMTAEVNGISNEIKCSKQTDNIMVQQGQNCITAMSIETNSPLYERKASLPTATLESNHAQRFLDAKRTEKSTEINDTECSEQKEHKGLENTRESFKTINKKKITYATFKEQKLENDACDNAPESVKNHTEEDTERIQTTLNKGNKPKECDEAVTKERAESMHSYKLRQCDSLKNVLRKTSPYCKLFGTVTIVIMCFILMFAPYNVATVIDVPCHCIEPWIYEDILAVLYYMHSLVNPYIYMATDRKFKAALKILWRRVKMKFNSIFRT